MLGALSEHAVRLALETRLARSHLSKHPTIRGEDFRSGRRQMEEGDENEFPWSMYVMYRRAVGGQVENQACLGSGFLEKCARAVVQADQSEIAHELLELAIEGHWQLSFLHVVSQPLVRQNYGRMA